MRILYVMWPSWLGCALFIGLPFWPGLILGWLFVGWGTVRAYHLGGGA